MWVLSVFVVFSSVAAAATPCSPKKGAGYWEFKGAEKGLKNSGAAWCYNWWVKPTAATPEGVEFVPMVRDEKSVNERDLGTAKANGKILLGFNEPDHIHEANMTVEQALMLWPQLEATGMRLGSPATAGGASSTDSWFGKFMRGVETNGHRVDFICVHHYWGDYANPAAGVDNLRKFLTNIHALYKRPIWLTEFALANWKTPATRDEQEAFIKAAVPMLESLPFVERYAWFALPPVEGIEGWLAKANLCNGDGALNACGVAYRDAK